MAISVHRDKTSQSGGFTPVLILLIVGVVAAIAGLLYFSLEGSDPFIEQTVWDQRIEAALAPTNCPPVKEKQFPDSYYKGPLIDSHFHFGSLPNWPNLQDSPKEAGESSDYAWLGVKVKVDDIACTFKHDGTVAAFSFFNVWPDIVSPSVEVTKLIMERYPTLFIPFIQPPNDPSPMVEATVLEKMLSVQPGLFKGLGEIGNYGPLGKIADPPPDAPLYLENYKLAREHNLMVYYHLGLGHQENLKKVLQQHPDINFIFHGDTAVMGVEDTDAGVQEELIGIIADILNNHPNAFYTVDELYGDEWLLQTGVSKEEFLAHFEDYEPLLEKDLNTWKEVIEAYPDQFLWGTDRGDEPIWTYDIEVGKQLTDYARAFIGRLDLAVQEKFAYKNAERLIK